MAKQTGTSLTDDQNKQLNQLDEPASNQGAQQVPASQGGESAGNAAMGSPRGSQPGETPQVRGGGPDSR